MVEMMGEGDAATRLRGAGIATGERILQLAGAAAQEALGATLAALVPDAFLIYLEGDLGAGKTTLVRGFLRGWGYPGPVKSPTYTLVESYRSDGRACFHFDLYRLADPEELEYLGLRDILDEGGVVLVEWPERGHGLLPPPDLRIRIDHLNDGRRLRLTATSEAGAAVLAAWPASRWGGN
jgi:tRNA threonylcarbamoyladenosine biosynthesis protein TsaE